MLTLSHISRRGPACRILLFLAMLLVTASVLADRPTPPVLVPAEPAELVDDDEGLAPRPAFESTPAVAATFLRESYRGGETAYLVLWQRESSLTLQVFHAGPEHVPTIHNIDMQGVPVTPLRRLRATAAHAPILVRIGSWPSGLYFAR